jgi:predicted heme/steroid binding protein
MNGPFFVSQRAPLARNTYTMKRVIMGLASKVSIAGVVVTALLTTGAVAASFLRSSPSADSPEVGAAIARSRGASVEASGTESRSSRLAASSDAEVLGDSAEDGIRFPATVVPPAAPATPIVSSATAAPSGAATTFDFTPQTLALHNTSGDCYVAYQGTVYDVSAHPSWVGCTHHGVSGGVDITSFFPHPTTYFNGLPVKGTYGVPGSTAATVVTPGATPTAPAPSGVAASQDSDGSSDDRFGWDDD